MRNNTHQNNMALKTNIRHYLSHSQRQEPILSIAQALAYMHQACPAHSLAEGALTDLIVLEALDQGFIIHFDGAAGPQALPSYAA